MCSDEIGHSVGPKGKPSIGKYSHVVCELGHSHVVCELLLGHSHVVCELSLGHSHVSIILFTVVSLFLKAPVDPAVSSPHPLRGYCGGAPTGSLKTNKLKI